MTVLEKIPQRDDNNNDDDDVLPSTVLNERVSLARTEEETIM
jgi:hypothetical protein